MKTLVFYFLTTLLLFTSSAYAGDKKEENSLEKNVKLWAATFNENSAKKMMAFYENSKDMDLLVSSGVWHHGYEEAKKKGYEFDETHWVYSDSIILKLKIRDFGKFGTASFEHQFKIASETHPVAYQHHIRTTMTLRKIKGVWKIIAEHSSRIDGIEPKEIKMQ